MGCANIGVLSGALDDLLTSVGTRIDYQLQRTTDYDPTTGQVTKLATVYPDIPALISTLITNLQGSLLDQDDAHGIVVMSVPSFTPSVGDLMTLPAASVHKNGPHKIGRVTEITAMYAGATPIQYTISWQSA